MNLTWCAFPIKSSQNAPLWVAWTSDTWRWWNSQHLALLVAVYGKSSLQNIRLRRRLFKSISACLACQTCQESDWFSNTNMDTRTVHTYYTHHWLGCPGLRNIIHSLDSCHLLPKEEPFVKKKKSSPVNAHPNIAIVEYSGDWGKAIYNSHAYHRFCSSLKRCVYIFWGEHNYYMSVVDLRRVHKFSLKIKGDWADFSFIMLALQHGPGKKIRSALEYFDWHFQSEVH